MIARKLFAILAACFLLVGLVATRGQAAQPSQIVVSYAVPLSITAGDNFSVTVKIDVPNDKPLTGIQFNLSWNSAVLDLTSVTNGNLFGTNSIDPLPATVTCPPNYTASHTPFFVTPTINHVAGTMINYGMAGLGIDAGQGCYGNADLATLNFHAVANGRSTNLISGAILSDYNLPPQAYPASAYSFPDFNLFVGEKLVVTSFTVAPSGLPSGPDFIVHATVANQGAVASLADTLKVTSDGHSTPASQNVNIPVIAAGGSTVLDMPGYSLTGGSSSSLVTGALGAQALNATYSKTYYVYLPALMK